MKIVLLSFLSSVYSKKKWNENAHFIKNRTQSINNFSIIWKIICFQRFLKSLPTFCHLNHQFDSISFRHQTIKSVWYLSKYSSFISIVMIIINIFSIIWCVEPCQILLVSNSFRTKKTIKESVSVTSSFLDFLLFVYQKIQISNLKVFEFTSFTWFTNVIRSFVTVKIPNIKLV